MTDFFRRHSLPITALFLVILSCQLMSASIEHRTFARVGSNLVESLLSPVERFHHETLLSIRRVWSHYVWLRNVESENNRLSARLKALEAQNSKLIETEQENTRLRTLLNFGDLATYHGVAAAIIGREPSNWARAVTIDRGTEDGVFVGSPAVDGNAVVGQVISAQAHSAKVLLLTDNTSAVDAIVQSSRAQGLIEGTLEKSLRFRFVERDATVQPGERVIASGLDGVFPKGTLIGVVTHVEPAGGGLFQKIEVEPSTDLDRLENVLVLSKKGVP